MSTRRKSTNTATWPLILAVLLLAGPALGQDWSALSVRAEDDRMAALGVSFPEAGNAAELYLPYLTGQAAISREPWFNEIVLAMADAPGPGDEDKLARAAEAAAPDLAVIVSASRRAECRVWGVYFKPEANRILFSQNTPEYIALFRLAVIITARADQLERDHDLDQARDLDLSVMRLAHHLEHEPDLFAYVVGLALKDTAARRLVRIYQQTGDPAAARFDGYAETARQRLEIKNQLLREVPDWDRESVTRLVLDSDAPYALRFDTLVARHYCLHDEDILVRCALLGAPAWVRRLEDEFARQDDLSRQFVEVIQAHRAQLKWLK